MPETFVGRWRNEQKFHTSHWMWENRRAISQDIWAGLHFRPTRYLGYYFPYEKKAASTARAQHGEISGGGPAG